MIPKHTIQLIPIQSNGCNNQIVLLNQNNNYNKQIDSIVIKCLFGCGSVHEKKQGTAHYLEHLLLRGNKEYPKKKLIQMNYTSPLNISASTSRESTQFECYTNEKWWKRDIKTFLSLLFQPSFNSLQMNHKMKNELKIIETERKTISFDKTQHFFQLHHENIFGKNSAFGHDILGSSKSLQQMKIHDLSSFYKQYYGLNTSCIGIYTSNHKLNESILKEIEHIKGNKIKSIHYNPHSKIVHYDIKQMNKNVDDQVLITKGSYESRLITDVVGYQLNKYQQTYHLPYSKFNILLSHNPINKSFIHINVTTTSQYLSSAMKKFNEYPSSLLDFYMNKNIYSSYSSSSFNIHHDYQFIKSLTSNSLKSLFN